MPKDRYSEVKTEEYSVPICANAEKDDGLYGYTDKAREVGPQAYHSCERNDWFYSHKTGTFFASCKINYSGTRYR